jgi:hypothetical protein
MMAADRDQNRKVDRRCRRVPTARRCKQFLQSSGAGQDGPGGAILAAHRL